MSRTPSRRKVRESYLELVRHFPLRPLRNDAEHADATAIVQDMFGRRLDAGEADYLDALLVFVNRYEEAHHAIDTSMTPAEVIRALMDNNSLSQTDMAAVIGSQSAVSMILAGTREPSKAQIARLCERFRLSADLFIGRSAAA